MSIMGYSVLHPLRHVLDLSLELPFILSGNLKFMAWFTLCRRIGEVSSLVLSCVSYTYRAIRQGLKQGGPYLTFSTLTKS